MNKNLVKYPIRFGTLLLAGAALVACKKEEFTEANALTLEKDRLTFLNDQRNANMILAEKERNRLMTWQRSMDSLDRINAGGRVFYTVIPVAANETTFSGGGNTGGGRTEEAITTAVVTISQYGRAFTTAAGGALNGVYTFPELRSGEVSVNVTATGFTQLNYVANLTPDGGIPNNGTINVGNVVPMFEVAAAIGTNKMAVIKGRAFFEGDLTNTTTGSVIGGADLNAGITDELVTPAILNNTTAAGTVANLVTASIDVTRNDGSTTGTPYFHQRFITESNGEGVNAFGVRVQSGAIQRFSYSKAVTYGTVNATGDYAMLIPASAAGLPIRLNYSEFAFNRTYWNAAGQLVTNERFLYGPNVTPTDIPQPTFSRPQFLVEAFTTPAQITTTFTPQSTGAQLTSLETAGTFIDIRNVSTVAMPNANNFSRSGFYATAPTVSVTGIFRADGTIDPTVTATTVASLSSTLGAANRANSAAVYQGANGTTGFTVAATNQTEFETAFKTINAVQVNSDAAGVLLGGSGYAGDGSLSFTRTDIVNAAGFGGQAAGSGSVGGYVNLSTTTPIQVTDGGSNFLFNTATTVTPTTANQFTNYLPTVVFTETNQAGSADPDKGYNSLVPAVTDATARLFVDYAAGYLNNPFVGAGVDPLTSTRPNGVGAIQEVRLTGAGSYPNATLPFVNFSFGQAVSSTGFTGVSTRHLFVSNGNGGIKFNEALVAGDISSLFTGAAGTIDATGSGISFSAGWGSRYTYLPRVELVANAAATTAGTATLTNALQTVGTTVTVNSNPADAANFGKIIRVVLNTPINVTYAGGAVGPLNNDFLNNQAPFTGVNGNFQISLRAVPQRNGNTLAAIGGGSAGRTVATGSALNTYSYSATAQTASQATTLATAMGGAKSNTTTINLSTAEYLAGNNMLVIFDAPNNLTVTGRKHAWGVPVFVTDNSGAVGNVLAGARIIDGGSGYLAPTSGTVNFTSAITAKLVPNPWFRTNVPVPGITGPASLTAAAFVTMDSNNSFNGVSPATPSTVAQSDVLTFLNHPTMTGQGIAFRPTPIVTRARIDFTIVNGGTGYSVAPRIVLSGGGLNLLEYPGTSGSAAAPTGGVITFNTRINSLGTVTSVSGPSGLGAGSIFQRSTRQSTIPADFNLSSALIANQFLFTTTLVGTTNVSNAPRYTSAPTTYIIEELSAALTRELNTPVTLGGVGGRITVANTGTGTAITGTVANVSFGAQTAAGADGTDITNIPTGAAYLGNFSRVEVQSSATAINNLVEGPKVTVPKVSGAVTTGDATFISYVTVDPVLANSHRRITRIVVVNGGSGYGVARVNSWFRANGGGAVVIPGGSGNTTTPANGNGAAGQTFTLFGNFGGANGNTQQGQNQTNYQFDAYPGLTYVRDVHYGTGQRLD